MTDCDSSCRIQMTIEMRPADLDQNKSTDKVARTWIVKDKTKNLIDQLNLLTGHPKQSIVDDAIYIVSIMYSQDPDKVKEILSRVYSDSI